MIKALKSHFVISGIVIIGIIGLVVLIKLLTDLSEEKINPRYLEDPSYCEQGSDCVVSKDSCAIVNKYYYETSRVSPTCFWEIDAGPCIDSRCSRK